LRYDYEQRSGYSRLVLTTLRTKIAMVTAKDAGFENWEWVTAHIHSDDKLARSSAPHYNGQDSDQELTDDSIEYLKEKKIEHVINLNSKAGDATITEKLKDNNIAYTPLPVEDYQPPTLKDLETGNKEYRKHRAGTLVWCGAGYGRTGTMISALQIYAEKDKSLPKKLTHDGYKKNHVETNKQMEVLDTLQNGISA
jgi:protein-tyrosine phosphatase